MEDLSSIINSKYSNATRHSPRRGGMAGFTQIQNRILKDSSLNTYEKLTIVILKMYMMNKNTCWPSQSTLARHVKCGVSTIKKTLKSLEVKGILNRSNKVNVRSKTYKLRI